MLTLEDWINKLQNNNNNIKLGLDNTLNAAKVLKLAKPAPYVITVAGTNGKGSVVRLLEAMFTGLGFKTGCYTSPHLVDFNERMCVNQNKISSQDIINSFEYVDNTLNKNNINLTFFEFITISAWNYFNNIELDILILEIGLGGRLDAVNAIPKDLAIITCVDFDHQNFLGDTLDAIGKEKAGIIENNKPVILGNKQFPESVLEIAKFKASKIYQFETNYAIKQDLTVNNGYTKKYISTTGQSFEFSLEPSSNIKLQNIATAIKALEVFDMEFKSCIKSNLDKIINIINNFNLLGRCSWLNKEKSILVDVAHNKQSIENLTNFLKEVKKETNKKIIAICGMLGDKDTDACLNIIAKTVNYWNFVTIDDKRGENSVNLAKIIKGINKNCNINTYDNFEKCYNFVYDFLKGKEKNNSIIVVFGSFHVVGPLYKFITSLKDIDYQWKFN